MVLLLIWVRLEAYTVVAVNFVSHTAIPETLTVSLESLKTAFLTHTPPPPLFLSTASKRLCTSLVSSFSPYSTSVY